VVSEREFDYSWDDQDPDEMTDLVSGAFSTSPDPEDNPLTNFHCYCDPDDLTDECDDCNHSKECCRLNSICYRAKRKNRKYLPCSCHKATLSDDCNNCGHSLSCRKSNCSHPNRKTNGESAPVSEDVEPITLIPSDSLLEAVVQLRALKSHIQNLESQALELRDIIVEAAVGRETILVDPKDPNKVLASILIKPFTWMRAGGKAKLKSEHPEIFEALYETKAVTRLVLKNEKNLDL
jgi:hypothetical protein